VGGGGGGEKKTRTESSPRFLQRATAADTAHSLRCLGPSGPCARLSIVHDYSNLLAYNFERARRGLEAIDNVSDRAYTHGHRNHQANHAQSLQKAPPLGPPGDLALGDVHADGEVDRERPEAERAEEPQHGVEEGYRQRHRSRRADYGGPQDELVRRDGDRSSLHEGDADGHGVCAAHELGFWPP
jgi:hypothetical protein